MFGIIYERWTRRRKRKTFRSLKTKQETSISKEIKRTRKTKIITLVTFWVISNGEFDPGSGWTLAACLRHASRTRRPNEVECLHKADLDHRLVAQGSIRQLIQNLKGWITELGEKRKELLAQKAAEEATLLPNLLMKYMEIRKEERKDWTRAGQNRGTSQDLKAVSEALSYLRQKGPSTVEDLEALLESSGKSAAD